MKWHNLTVEETLKELDASRSGLSEEKAKERLHQYGPNELTAKGKTPDFLVFLRQFASPLIYILLAATLIEFFVMHKPTDASVILTALMINSIVGFIQENRAERAMEALKRLAVGFFSNRLLLGAIGLAILLQAMVIYAPPFQKLFYIVPLSLEDWGVVVLMAGGLFVIEELRKLVAPSIFNRGK